MQQSNAEYFSHLVRALRCRVSRYAYYGLAIAVVAVVLATVAAVVLAGEPLTLSNLYAAQRNNVTLLAMDVMPFVFALWGQYVHVILSHEAGAMVLDETDRLRTDKAALQAEARRLEQQDALTGLANRTHFIELLENSLAAAHLNRTRIGIIVLDLDGFSEVNDQFGAANGDQWDRRLFRVVLSRPLANSTAPGATLSAGRIEVLPHQLGNPRMMEMTRDGSTCYLSDHERGVVWRFDPRAPAPKLPSVPGKSSEDEELEALQREMELLGA